MAVIKVKVVSIIGRMQELDRVTEICGRSGFFHPDNALQFYENTEAFTPLSEENRYATALQRLNDALQIINKEPRLLPDEEVQSLPYTDDDAFSYVDTLC